MCKMLTTVVKDAVKAYVREDGMDELAFARLEALLRVVVVMVEDHSALASDVPFLHSAISRKRHAEEAAALRIALASLNSELTKMAERLLLVSQKETEDAPRDEGKRGGNEDVGRKSIYVRVLLSGFKPQRFTESTSIPAFLEWNNPSVCRVPQSVVETVLKSPDKGASLLHQRICNEFGRPLRDALSKESNEGSVLFSTGGRSTVGESDESITYLDVTIVHINFPGLNLPQERGEIEAKRFFCRKPSEQEPAPPGQPGQELPGLQIAPPSHYVELTVAQSFPCALSRQRTLIASEVVPESV